MRGFQPAASAGALKWSAGCACSDADHCAFSSTDDTAAGAIGRSPPRPTQLRRNRQRRNCVGRGGRRRRPADCACGRVDRR
eukprot:1872083-Prymnesium_polylepis.1